MKGFTTEKTVKGREQKYQTLQPIGSGKQAVDAVVKSVFEIVPTVFTITAVSRTGINNGIEEGLQITAVGCGTASRRGDVIRMQTGALDRSEIAIMQVIDNDNVVIGHSIPVSEIGSTFKTLRHNTLTLDDNGLLAVAVGASGPINYVEDSVDTEVEIDTATPANNKPLPSALYIDIDGTRYPVAKDTGTPANTVSVPVEITGAAGPINITAGDLNVQLTDQGANFDATRIGDGTNLLGINASLEALVHDTDALAKLTDIETALNTNLDIVHDYFTQDFNSINLAVGFNTLDTLGADIKKIQVINNSGGTIALRITATGTEMIIAPGASIDTNILGANGDVVQLSALGAIVSSGNIYINYMG